VTWFTNRFDHFIKIRRHGPAVLDDPYCGDIVLLDSRGYRSNVSIARWLDHRELAKAFRKAAEVVAAPDIIVASMPTIELCRAAVSYGHERSVPTVVDVRDQWPDALWELWPRRVRPLARLAALPLERELRSALSQASGITSHVDAFITWAMDKCGRARGDLERTFPLGYQRLRIDEADRMAAITFWHEKGVDFTSGEWLVVYAGTISRQCDFTHVLDTAAELDAEGVRFVLCGAGDSLARIQAASAKTRNVCAPGWCRQLYVQVLLENASAGLMPYRRLPNFVNAIPNKAIEYMAMALPILWSFEEGALAELLREERIGATYSLTRSSLVAQIRAMRSDPAGQSAAGARARAIFATRYGAAAVYGSMTRYLESIATRSHGRA
jgi:glycosyltransferase involved in cell wall biosynthesis